MGKLIEYFIKYPIWANSFIVLTVIIGLFSYHSLNKSYFPLTPNRAINIQVVQPGTSPEEIESGITTKVEEALIGIQGVDRITSTSRENTSTVLVEIVEGYDLDKALTDVKNAVDGITGLPVDAEKPLVFLPKNTQLSIQMVLSGEVPKTTLKETGERIEDDLMAEDFISQVSVTGFPELEIAIKVKEEALLRYSMTMDEIANAVSLNNRDISGGSIKSEEEEILIRSNQKMFEADEIAEIVIRASEDGSVIRLKDVAEVVEQFQDDPVKTLFNTKPAVTITVNKLIEEDVEKINSFVKAYRDSFNKQNPVMQLTVTRDETIRLQQRIDLLVKNGGIGLLLVLASLGFFLNLRLSFWVAVGIPLSFMGMFIAAALVGITINMISLFGMILVIGILVDDGIVIAENIYAQYEKGKSATRAAIDGAVEVLPAVFASVTTTMLFFSLLFFIQGRTGDIIKEMAVVVIGCLGFSLIEATLVLPPHLALSKAMRDKKEEDKNAFDRFGNKIRNAINKGLDFVRYTIYGSILKLSLRFKYASVSLLLVFCMSVVGMMSGGIIPFTFFPPIDGDNINVNLVLLPGTTENITEDILRDIETQIWEVNEELSAGREDGESVVVSTKIQLGSAESESGGHCGTIDIQLLDGETRNVSSSVIANMFREAIGTVPEAQKLTFGGFVGFGKPVSVNMTSGNAEELEAAKVWLKDQLRTLPTLKDITDNDIIGKRELEIELKPKAYMLGLDHSEISNQIRQGFFGQEIQRLQKGSDEVKIWIRFPEEDRKTIGQLEQMRIKTMEGDEYPLMELIDYEIVRGTVLINHFDTKRQILVEASLQDESLPAQPILEEIQSSLVPELQAKFPSVMVSFEGQSQQSAKFADSLMKMLPLVLLVAIILITLVFRSWVQAVFLIILPLLPMGVLCGIFGHWFHDKPLSILSNFGLIALCGIIINDAVVFLSKFNSNIKEGMKVRDAAYQAGLDRFRPIMLTSITTVLGLYPLILGKSLQAQFLIPMAISVAYGVLFGTLFIIICYPALILVVNDIRRALQFIYDGGKWPSREEVEPAMVEEKSLEKRDLE